MVVIRKTRRLKKAKETGRWIGWFSSMTVLEKLGLLLLVGLGMRPILDPDFGWHLRAGTDLLVRHFWPPKFDVYSYTMPDWSWVNHEWLTDGIIALIHNELGPLVLIILFALLIGGIFLLAASVEQVQLPYKILAALIGLLAALPITGVRMQMLTLLGMAWLLWTLYRYRRGELKHLWYVPLIFVAWANLHGGFLIGLVILVVFWLCELIKYVVRHWQPTWYKKLHITELTLNYRQLRHLGIIGLLSGVAPLLNPYGWGLYYDFYKLFTNPFAIKNIAEWQPVSLALNHPIALDFTLYLILFALVLLLTYRKIEPTRWVITGLFLYLSFLYWRNLPFFMIMSVGFLAEILQRHTDLAFKVISQNKWILVTATLIVSVIIGQRIIDVGGKVADPAKSFRAGGYPIDAIHWARNNIDKLGQRMFNEYDWGGFLIWQFPEQKVFVDGRMPFWKIGDRFPFFDEQYAMGAERGSIEMLETKYDVDWILIRPARPLAIALTGQDNWMQVYRDDYAVIYHKVTKIDDETQP